MTLLETIKAMEVIASHQPSIKMVVENDIFRLNAKADVLVAAIQGTEQMLQRVAGQLHGLGARDLSCAARVDDDGVGMKGSGGSEGSADIVDAFQPLFLLGGCERNEVGRVQRHEDPMLTGFVSDGT